MSNTLHRQLAAVAALAVFLCLFAPRIVFGFEVRGRVVNGTTEKPVAHTTVTAVKPSGGMMVEQEVETDENGQFSLTGLSEQAPIYLLRVTYDDIHYNEPVQFSGTDPYEVEVLVYDKTNSWDNIHISVPHMMVGRSADTLTVSKLIQITNHSSPPKTVYGDNSRYRLYIPPDALAIQAVSVRSLGMPLPMTPTPTTDPGFYTLDYPIKPGDTSIQVQYDLPYAGGSYHYTEPLEHDLSQLLIISQDPGIDVKSATMDIGPPEDFRGFKSVQLENLAAGGTIDLAFSGGNPSGQGGGAMVSVIPNPTEKLGFGAMIILVVMLVGFMFMLTGREHSPSVEKEVLELQKEELLNQIARLDDLHKTGTVSDQMYRLTRSELASALASIYYRTTFAKQEKTPPQNARTKGAASVPE